MFYRGNSTLRRLRLRKDSTEALSVCVRYQSVGSTLTKLCLDSCLVRWAVPRPELPHGWAPHVTLDGVAKFQALGPSYYPVRFGLSNTLAQLGIGHDHSLKQ